MPFQPGQSGNPRGRPKGCLGGRLQVLALLDAMLSKKGNQKLVIDALEADLRANPLKFFHRVIVPLLPKESRLSLDQGGAIKWTSLLTVCEVKKTTCIGLGDGGSSAMLPVGRDVQGDQNAAKYPLLPSSSTG